MKLLITAALAATAFVMPASALAQARPTILVVDTGRIMSDCTACKSATATLKQRDTANQTRAKTLQTQLTNEGKPIQTAINALNGKDPDAALEAKIKAFQTKERSAQQEVATAQRTLQSTAAHVQQQIGQRLITIVEQVRARRGASIVVAKDSTLANDNTIDVTGEVLTALNQQLPAVSVTPLPQQSQQQQQSPQGR
jgi:Skp family chaperone for outer membrane proteins